MKTLALSGLLGSVVAQFGGPQTFGNRYSPFVPQYGRYGSRFGQTAPLYAPPQQPGYGYNTNFANPKVETASSLFWLGAAAAPQPAAAEKAEPAPLPSSTAPVDPSLLEEEEEQVLEEEEEEKPEEVEEVAQTRSSVVGDDTCSASKNCNACFRASCFWQESQGCRATCNELDEACYGVFANVPKKQAAIRCPAPELSIILPEPAKANNAPAESRRTAKRRNKGPRNHQNNKPRVASGEKLVSCVVNVPVNCRIGQQPPPLPTLEYELATGAAGEVCVEVARHYCIPRLSTAPNQGFGSQP